MKRFLAATLLFLTCNVFAEDADIGGENGAPSGVELPAIIISPTKYETPLYGIPSSFTVVYEDEILSKGKPQVKDILKDAPGLNVAQSGGFGAATSIFIRGAESSHSLVMIDGVKVCDPTSTNGAFNFANLTLDNVERVEVLRGSHSTLYGSDAIGGVINIITKKGSGAPRVWASFEMGSHSTFKESFGSYGEFKGLSYSMAFARIDSNGISMAAAKYDNDETDDYSNTSFSSRLDFSPYDGFTAGTTFRYTDAEIEIDDSGGYGGDDPNRRNREKQIAASCYAEAALTKWWDVNLKWLWLYNKRFDKDFADYIDTNEYLYSEYKGSNVSYEFHNVFKLGEFGTLSGGIDYDKQQSDPFYYGVAAWGATLLDAAKAKDHNIGYYLQNRLTVGKNFYSIAGFRIDDHSEFGLHDTYKVSGKYIFDWGMSVKGTWATGFKAPSLYQLYDPGSGNSSLKPEKSKGYEIGIGQQLNEGMLEAESTYFYTELDNLIDWVMVDPLWFTGEYQNVTEARIWGLENLLVFKPADWIKVKYSYTYLNTRNEKTKQGLDRRPRNKSVVNLELKPLDDLDIQIFYLYAGDRKDKRWIGGAEHQIILEDYHKIDASGRYVVNDNLEFFGRIENITDIHYEEIDGYGTPGRSFYAGAKATF